MEWLKNMNLKKSFFLLSVGCVLISLVLIFLVFSACDAIRENYPTSGISFSLNGVITRLEPATAEQQRILSLLSGIEIFSRAAFPLMGLGAAGGLFYHIKLKKPIELLRDGTGHIRANDLDFSIPAVSKDELGQICAAFETMRLELLKTNQELWRQAEERKRLNAAFAHDLRNPITVLKGSLKLLQKGTPDEQAIDRLESYTLRIEQYIEAMSSIQRMEQMPVRASEVTASVLQTELEETSRLFAPALNVEVSVPDIGTLQIDHGIFLTVAENLIGNAARFAQTKLEIALALEKNILFLSVIDDGPGFPAELIESGPKPFGKSEESPEHFGMGLYSSSLLCLKHGGNLRLENSPVGAVTTASIQINFKP